MEVVVQIFHNGEGKITEVQDKWNGELPDGAITKVSVFLNIYFQSGVVVADG
jgi:hypothetical protein